MNKEELERKKKYDEILEHNILFVSHMFSHIHKAIMEIITQCYEEDPNGETEIGYFDVDGLKKWRKDNGIS